MLIAKAERTDLLHLGIREWDLQTVKNVPIPEQEGCVLVWRGRPGTLPDALVVADGSIQSFLAWITTYAPQLTPIQRAMARAPGRARRRAFPLRARARRRTGR